MDYFNVFENAGGISVGTDNNVKVYIRNNVFYKQNSGFAVENWASYSTSETVVEYNSFYSTDRIALRLPSGYNSAKMTAVNNYWNTTDTSIIDNMIFDKKDDLGSAGTVNSVPLLKASNLSSEEPGGNYITYEPFLTERDANTPYFDIQMPILSYINMQYRDNKAMVDKNITIKFNRNIYEGSAFDKTTLRDSSGNIVPVGISINNNELVISPSAYMDYNKTYNVYVANNGIMDAAGNSMESDYRFTFSTEDPRWDVDNSASVDILDLAAMAQNYNSKPDNKGWNPLNDLNGDKVIDIYDLVMVSRHMN